LQEKTEEPNYVAVDSLVVRLALPSAVERRTCSRSVLKFDPLLASERRQLSFLEGTK